MLAKQERYVNFAGNGIAEAPEAAVSTKKIKEMRPTVTGNQKNLN